MSASPTTSSSSYNPTACVCTWQMARASFSHVFDFSNVSFELMLRSRFEFLDRNHAKNLTVARILLSIYATGILLWRWIWNERPDTSTSHIFLIYLTNWNALMVTLYLDFITIASIYNRSHTPTYVQGQLSKTQKLLWILCETSFSYSFLVTVLFWLLLFPGNIDTYTLVQSIHGHGVTLLWMLIEVIISRILFLPAHLWLLFLYGFAYLLLNGIHTAVAYPPYSIMTWKSGGTALVIVEAFVAMTLFFWFGRLIALYRDRLLKTQDEVQPQPASVPMDYA